MGAQRKTSGWGRRREDRSESHEAQLLWTFCVAIAVALAAIFQMTAPKSVLLQPTDTASNGQAQLVGNERAPAAQATGHVLPQ